MAAARRIQPCYSDADDPVWLTYPEWRTPGLLHGIAVFKNLHPGQKDWFDKAAESVRKRFPMPEHKLLVPQQTHTAIVRKVGAEDATAGPIRCDGLVTNETGLMLGVTVADCIPLLAVCATDHVIGVAHCGWKGIASGIVERFVETVRSPSRKSEGATFLLGASIGACCYEVRGDLLEQFPVEEVRCFAAERQERVFLDLKSLAASRLIAAGVEPGQISIDKTCTSCKKYLLSSYRASGTECGRMLAVLMFTQ